MHSWFYCFISFLGGVIIRSLPAIRELQANARILAIAPSGKPARGLQSAVAGLVFGSLILSSACAPARQQADSSPDSEFWLLAGLYQSRSGNCLHSAKIAANAGLLHCDRTSYYACQFGQKYDPAGLLYFTSSLRSRYTTEIGLLVDQHPACQTAAAVTLALPGLKTKSTSDQQTAQSNNRLQSVSACESVIEGGLSSLLIQDAFILAKSPRGLLLTQALQLGENECYHALAADDYERGIVQALKDGSLLLQSSCRYGTMSAAVLPGYTDCSAAEKTWAGRFDFDAF
ncbi:MAG: hypothetical protein KDK39_16695 [Leptospiraceae bacterium]|nr:hypothetical protein [Leptospiraceae bacterium]